MPLATVLHQKTHQLADGVVAGAVENLPAFATRCNQARMTQGIEMKRQGRRRQIEPVADFTGRQSSGTLLDEQTKYSQPRLLRQGRQGLCTL